MSEEKFVMRIPENSWGLIEIAGATLIFSIPNLVVALGYFKQFSFWIAIYNIVMIYFLLAVITHIKFGV